MNSFRARSTTMTTIQRRVRRRKITRGPLSLAFKAVLCLATQKTIKAESNDWFTVEMIIQKWQALFETWNRHGGYEDFLRQRLDLPEEEFQPLLHLLVGPAEQADLETVLESMEQHPDLLEKLSKCL